MSFDSDILLQRLEPLVEPHRDDSRYLIAYSGGLDSTVLLHALSQSKVATAQLTAVHINHGLHPDADSWELHCRQFAESLGVAFDAVAVVIDERSGLGIEATARESRYAALMSLMHPGDYLLSAHHEDDQAETLLLNLMRGSGISGMAGIGRTQPFGPGHLLRPLLGIPRASLEEYAERHAVEWIDDPANDDQRFDRNFLRREILPRLTERWPATSARLARSAELAAESADLLQSLARIDLADNEPSRLDIRMLLDLPEPRQRNLLRYAIRAAGLPPAPATRLVQILEELVSAREDAQPLVQWSGAEARRFRQHLYLLQEMPQQVFAGTDLLRTDRLAVIPGESLGQLELRRTEQAGIDPSLVQNGLAIRFREGGESIRPLNNRHRKTLRNLLQERAVVPWMRQRIPLLYAGDELVAVGDLWVSADHVAPHGYRVEWNDRPRLY